MTERRLNYIDNIRIFLTAIVILNHLSITYGAPGGWYYNEFEVSQLNLIPMATLVLFAAGNQAYSMGLFFLLSGFFSAKSISNNGVQSYLSQRLIRLGIPVLLYVYLISQILRITFRKIVYNIRIDPGEILQNYRQISFGYELGPMWFIMLLLIFSFFLPILIKSIRRFSNQLRTPGRYGFLLVAVIVGLLTFLIRIYFPIGSVFQPLNLQLPHVIQYIIMFLAGVLVYQSNWQERVQSISVKFWLPFTIALIIIMPILFFLVGGASGNVNSALGGFTWQSLAFSIWEQVFCLSMAAVLISLFYKYLNKNTEFSRELTASSYATYIFHPLVLVIFTALFQDFRFPPLAKFALLAAPTLLLCFFAASLLRRLPGLKTIL